MEPRELTLEEKTCLFWQTSLACKERASFVPTTEKAIANLTQILDNTNPALQIAIKSDLLLTAIIIGDDQEEATNAG